MTFVFRRFALLLAIGCACATERPLADESAEADEETTDEDDWRVITSGSSLTRLTLSRINRSATDLATRAATIASVMSQATCSASQAESWARLAIEKRGRVKIAVPFSCNANLEVSYMPYYDALVVHDLRSVSPPTTQLYQTSTDPRPAMGIGKAAARTIANNLFSSLTTTGLVNSSWTLVESRKIIDGVASESGGNGSRVREFLFGYRRHVNSVPILDSLVEIGVDSGGVVRTVRINDVSSVTNGQETAARSEANATALFEDLAQDLAETHGPEAIAHVKHVRPAYSLPNDAESIVTSPVLFGEIVVQQDIVLSRMQKGTLSFVAANPTLSIMSPWAGDPVTATLPNGSWCGSDASCTSGKCYTFAGYYGICGGCKSGSDCSSSSCNPPNPGEVPIVASQCGTGVAGSGCETTTDCTGGRTCQVVGAGARGFTLKTCSSCSSDSQCGTGARCKPYLDWASNKAYLRCVADGSLTLGQICGHDLSCASGKCADYKFPDGTTVGVCSTCETSSHCSSGTTCKAPTFALGSGFSGGACN